MKSSLKYILLTLFAFIVSVFIYEYITKSKDVLEEEDILSAQSKVDDTIFNNTSYSIDDPKVIVNPYGNSPLTALVIFETKDLTSPTVKVIGKDEDSTITNTFLPSKKHILPIYGLYPDTENKVIIEVSGKEKELTIQTDSITEDVPSVTDSDINVKSNELYVVSTDTYPAAFDCNGDLRWYLNTKYTWDIERLNNGHIILGNNKLSKDPYYSIGLVELDLLGKVYYEYNTTGGYHHDVYEMENGNLLLVSNNLKGKTKEDYIIEIDRNTGKIHKEFDFQNILNSLESGDWLHIDSISFDKETNSITIAGKNNNTIVNVDYPSGEINYIIGSAPDTLKKYEIKAEIKNPLSASNVKNELTYYSNGKINNVLVNTKDAEIEEKFTYDVGDVDDIDVQKTENGYLFATNNYVKELTDDEENYLEFNSNINNVKKMSLYANDTYDQINGVRLGEIGVTKKANNGTVLFYKDGTEFMKKHNIKLYKDALRLVVTGDFDKDDNVEIILDNVLDKKTYKMNTKNGENSMYINEDGIKGKYYIYIKYNGKIYKTYKCVTLY